MKTSSKSDYIWVWAALMFLLLVTWGLAEVNLGVFNNAVALGVAFIKMTLVLLVFMHVRHEPPLTWVFVAAGLVWLLIMIELSLSDYLMRAAG